MSYSTDSPILERFGTLKPMRIAIACAACRRCLHGVLEIGCSPAALLEDFGWTFSPALGGHLCSSCAAAYGLKRTDVDICKTED